MGKAIIVIHVVFMTLFVQFASLRQCEPGTYRYNNTRLNFDICVECPEGTYMSLSDHQLTKCKSCENISEPNVEILISPCNKTHDAVIHCVEGYYRDEARNPRETGKCRKCTKCSKFTGQPCSTYRDTVCCWDQNYDVVPNHHGVPMCRERPWFCGRGEYFETSGFHCLPCPDNTFMPLDYHIQPKCLDCRELEADRPRHSVIIQPCNSTHAPVIGCEDGFFRDPNMGYRDDATGCSPCTDCSTKADVQYEGRNCNSIKDTVCCPQSNMTVFDTPKGPVCCPQANMTIVDTSDGFVCEASSAICDVGYCLIYHIKNGSSTCGPCFDNTDGDQPDSGFEDHTFLPGPSKQVSHEKTGDARTTISSACNGGGLIYLHFLAGLVTGWMTIIMFIILLFHWKYLRESFLGTWLCGKFRSLIGRHRGLHRDEIEEQVPLNRRADKVQLKNKARTINMSDCGELEQSFGNEIDLEAKKKTCPRLSDHANLFGVEGFAIDNLPPDFRDQRYLDCIKATSDLTVRLQMYHISEDRPENDPYYEFRGLKGLGVRRYGNGLVYHVSKRFDDHSNEKCPCKDCQLVLPENAKTNWAEFLVLTSAQIVFDETECGQTSCKLWNGNDENPGKIPSLKGWRVKEIDREKDVCIMRCVSHDPDFTNKLEKRAQSFKRLHPQNNQAANGTADVKKLAVLIAHPHGLSKKIFLRNANTERRQAGKWAYDDYTCPGSVGAPVCLLSNKKDSKILMTIYNGNRESRGFELDEGLSATALDLDDTV